MGAIEAAVSVAACLRTWATAEEIWKRTGACERPDSGALAGKYLEPGVEQRLLVNGFAGAAPELRSDEHFAGAQDGCKGHGEVRREFFHFAGICPAATNVLATFAVHEAGGPGGGVPCERVGRGFQRRLADQDMHPDSGGRLPDDSPRTGTQFLSTRIH